MQIGERFILGFYGKEIPAWLLEFERKFGLGGVVLFDYSCQTKQYDNNIESPEQLRELCYKISAIPSKPLICIDQEGGLVRRLKDSQGFTFLPSQWDFNKLSDKEKSEVFKKSASEMKEIGIHVDFTPVVDMNINPDNPDIGKVKRSYSAEPREIRNNVSIINKVAKEVNLGLCLKHFPGIGGATTNSHDEITDISNNLPDEQIELFYELAPDLSGDAVMLSHAFVKHWDEENPISISPQVIEMVRRRLPNTLLITDDIQMQGLQKIHDTKNSTAKAFTAGVDMVCIGNNMIDEQEKMLEIASAAENLVKQDKSATETHIKSLERVKMRKAGFAE